MRNVRFAPPKPWLLGCESIHKRPESEPVTDNVVRHEPDQEAGLAHKRALARGYGDSLSRGVELALLPAVFGFLGWLVDRWLGTSPAFVIGFVAFAFAGMLVRMWVGYDADMRRHEAELAAQLRTPGRKRGAPT